MTGRDSNKIAPPNGTAQSHTTQRNDTETMSNKRTTHLVKCARREILETLKATYPAAMRPTDIQRSLVPLLPQLSDHDLEQDLHYLMQKQYIEQVSPTGDRTPPQQPPTRIGERWVRLTAKGIELTDKCISDPAIEF